jgi:hypothetical protein
MVHAVQEIQLFFLYIICWATQCPEKQALLSDPLLNDQSIQVVIVERRLEGRKSKEIIKDPVIGKRVMMTGEISEKNCICCIQWQPFLLSFLAEVWPAAFGGQPLGYLL